MWQYTSAGGLDRNKSQKSLAQISGGVTPVKDEEEDMNGFYIQASSAGTKYWFSPATGKVRAISSAEWDFLRALESSHATGDTHVTKIELQNVSQGWLEKAIALGQ